MPPTVEAKKCAVSIIICTYNRVHSLYRTLKSLSAMSGPASFAWEVLVVDNNSKDDTNNTVALFSREASIDVRYVFEERQGLNYARNAGVKQAKGDLLFFLDDDVEVTANWLTEMKKAFDTYPVVGVGGRVLIKRELQKPRWWHEEYDGALGKFDNGDKIILSDDTYSSIIGIGANLSFKRSVFEQYGFFLTNLDRRKRKLLMGGDIEFAQRLKAAGALTMYYPAALVYHCPEVTRFTKLYLRRWYFRIGEWEAQKSALAGNEGSPLLHAPKWRYRLAAEQLVKTFSFFLTWQQGKRFYQELQFVSSLGYFFGLLKSSLRMLSLPDKY